MKPDSDICVKNNGHSIPHFVRHRAQKHVLSIGGGIGLRKEYMTLKEGARAYLFTCYCLKYKAQLFNFLCMLRSK